MDERIESLTDIVLDDDTFIEYVRNVAGIEETDVKKIQIPKGSFTSHQLTYGSAEEISHNHRSVLLGGIPRIWNLQHSYNIFTVIEKLSDVRLRKRVKYIYEKGRNKESRLVHWKNYHLSDSIEAFDENAKPSKLVTLFDNDDNSSQNTGRNSNTVVQRTSISLSNNSIRRNSFGETDNEDSASDSDEGSTLNSDFERQPIAFKGGPQDRPRPVEVGKLLCDESVNKKVLFGPQVKQTSQSSISRRSSLLNSKTPLKIIRPIPEPINSEEQLRIKNSQTRYVPFKRIGKKIVANIPDAHLENRWKRFYRGHSGRTNEEMTEGKILKMEKMLVMVKQALTARVSPSHFSEEEPVDTRIHERWKEYFVVARATGNSESPVRLQLYTSRKIKPLETGKRKPWHCKIQFDVDKKCLVEFYNSLDKSICIVKQDDHLTEQMGSADNNKIKAKSRKQFLPLQIFILRCDNLLSSSRWLVFLRSSIGLAAQPYNIDVHVPAVDLSLNIDLSGTVIRKLAKKAREEEKMLKILQLKNGYCVTQLPILRYLKLVIREMLLQLGSQDVVKKWDATNTLMGLCWKHYDRIEWAYGNQTDLLYGSFVLKKSHSLEYRTLKAYPRFIETPDDNHPNKKEEIYEPAPVEGFLSQNEIVYWDKGHKVSHPYFKLCYWFTSNCLLFNVRSVKATPPLPDDDIVDPYGFIKDREKMDEFIKRIPKIYETNPYPLDENGHLLWLNEGTSDDEFEVYDSKANKSFLRKISLLLKAGRCLDLTRCVDIRLFDASKIGTNTIKIWNESEDMVWKNGHTLEGTKSSIIEIVTSKHSSKLLIAPDAEICQEWISRLREISFYWKKRLAADRQILWDLKFKNLNTFNITELQEKHISGSAPKWMTELSATSDNIYNVSSHALSRPIIHQGLIYHKSRKHQVFRKQFMVLIPGFVLLYHCFDKMVKDFARNSVEYQHFLTVPIKSCYLYSGALSEQELLKRDKEFNSINPGSHSLSRHKTMQKTQNSELLTNSVCLENQWSLCADQDKREICGWLRYTMN
ncbi:unnamed protein product [Kluyveromyces dobzhanskii CBS 2104]|uniref:WGS project CCBQ000000000 data, contig 00015 n=1 Tax=Kluyveromyces dobzhanskii CBS 2104 TaxID=1427455 RepID=A0A0A8L9X8_9SACH|nr:unnamed protein product [Kluyveromyces dobzhanskii CBS 2104]